MELPLATENPFDLDALEGGVEVSIESSHNAGAILVEGDLCRQIVELQGEINDKQTESARLKSKVVQQAKHDWYNTNLGKDKLVTSIKVCDDTGTEVSLSTNEKVKAIPMLKSDGKPNPKHGVLMSITRGDTESVYRRRDHFEFSMDAVPQEHRKKLKEFLADIGIAPKGVLVPREHMHSVGRIPAGQDNYLTPDQQRKLEDKLGSRTWSIRTK